MSESSKLQSRIEAVANHPNGTEASEIVWILKRLGFAKSRFSKHGELYHLPDGSGRMLINEHNNGKKHLPRYCVDQFLLLMSELGYYE